MLRRVMADADMDIGLLSTSQQEALHQYTQVTNQDVKDAVPILQRSQWNVQVSHVCGMRCTPGHYG